MMFVYEYKGHFFELHKSELSDLYKQVHILYETLKKNPNLNYMQLETKVLYEGNQFTVEMVFSWKSNKELDLVYQNGEFLEFTKAWKIHLSTYKISAIEETNNRKLSKSWFSNFLNPQNIQILVWVVGIMFAFFLLLLRG